MHTEVAGLVVRDLDTAELQRQAGALYRRVFGRHGSDPDPDLALNPRLLSTVLRNGGSAVGVLDGHDQLLGFAYGVCGASAERVYHYSQAAAVAPEHQGRGLGRILKQAQADVARAAGARSMRWSFDPAVTRNGHFNLDVLGATGRWYVDDFYHRPGTDRVVVEWDLQEEPRRPHPVPVGDVGPADWGRRWVADGVGRLVVPASGGGHSGVLRDGFHVMLRRGLLARSCVRVTDDTAVYLFEDR